MRTVKVVIVVAMLALVAFMALPSRGVLLEVAAAQEPPPVVVEDHQASPPQEVVASESEGAPEAVTGGAFTYQGRLLRNGRAYNGTCSMTFSLYPGATALDPVGVLTKSILVSNGLFTTNLDFDVFPNPKPFTGEERYLGVRVTCDNVTETLNPRQPITAVPYALSLKPGAVVSNGNSSVKLVDCAGAGCTGIGILGSSRGIVVGRATDYGVRVDDSTPAAFYAKQTGDGMGVSSYSRYAVSIKSMSYNKDLYQGWEEVSVGGTQELRFKVSYGGYVYADGTYSSPAADFAEMLPAAAGLEAGDVLVVGTDGQLARSTSPDATNVAGVFATKPAFLGGFPNEEMTQNAPASQSEDAAIQDATAETELAVDQASKEAARDPLAKLYQEKGLAPLSITGIVPVKVSAENGPIVPGDLLSTASLPGHAMKASPVDVGGISLYRPGTIVGKALEGLEAETGVIRVLVTLQ